MNSGLTGKILIALPSIGDPRFHRAVILLCAHSPEFAMGIVLNKPMAGLRVPQLLEHLDIDTEDDVSNAYVLDGGPVSNERGFVLHTDDVVSEGATVVIDNALCLTASLDILSTIASSQGPRLSVLALGYSGWGRGQLEVELAQNAWLVAEPDDDLVFGDAHESKWRHALARLGIDSGRLQVDAGQA